MKIDVKGGTVYLRDRLDFAAGHAIRVALALKSSELRTEYGLSPGDDLPDEAVADLNSTMAVHTILRGIERWSFSEPVTRANIHRLLLDDPDRAAVLGFEVVALYQEQLMGPLANLAANSSPPSPTEDSTSPLTELPSPSENGAASNGSTHSPKQPKRSKPSSTSTTPTAVIVTTSSGPAGDSRSSAK